MEFCHVKAMYLLKCNKQLQVIIFHSSLHSFETDILTEIIHKSVWFLSKLSGKN